MLATFLILFNTLLFKYFSLNVYFEGIRILLKKFNNMKSLCQSSYPQKLEMISTFFCAILGAIAWAVLKL